MEQQDPSLNRWEKYSLDQCGQSYRFETDALEGTITFGTKGYLSVGKELPVSLRIRAKNKSFAGNFKITLPEENGDGVAYCSAINCGTKNYKTEMIMIPNLGVPSYFLVEILDQFGGTYFSQIVIPEEEEDSLWEDEDGKEYEKLYFGVLCDENKQLDYLEKLTIEINGSTQKICLIPYTTENFPMDTRQLNSLTGMIIDDFDSSTLNGRQLDAMDSWIRKRSGILLVGTGDEGGKVLSGLKGKYRLICDKKTETEDVALYFQDLGIGNSTLSLPLFLITPQKENGWKEGEWSLPASYYEKQVGKGKIYLCKFSFSEEALLQWIGRDESMSALFTKILQSEIDASNQQEIYWWYIKRAVYAFVDSQLPNTFFYGLFFILYLLCLGTGGYYILHRMKCREYIWGVIPAISLLFTLFILFRSRGLLDGSDVSFSAVRIVDHIAEKDEAYLLYQNREGKNTAINLSEEVADVETGDDNYVRDQVEYISTKQLKTSYTINNTKNGYNIEFADSVPGTTRMLHCNMETKSKTVDTDPAFYIEKDKSTTLLSGHIYNRSDVTFQRILVIWGKQYQIIENLETKESRKLKQKETLCWSDYEENHYLFTEEQTAVYANLMEYAKQKYLIDGQNMNYITVVGISTDKEFSLLADGNRLENHVFVSIERYLAEKQCEYVADITDSCVSSVAGSNGWLEDTYKEGENTLFSSDGLLKENKTQVCYQFGKEDTISEIIRNPDLFTGTIYAYDYKRGCWEAVLKKAGNRLSGEKLGGYLNEDHEMKLLFEFSKDSGSQMIPVLSAKIKH